MQPAPSESGDNVVATVHVENEEKISDEPDSTQSKNGMKKSKSKKQLKDQSWRVTKEDKEDNQSRI